MLNRTQDILISRGIQKAPVLATSNDSKFKKVGKKNGEHYPYEHTRTHFINRAVVILS